MPKEKKATLLKPSNLPTMNYQFRKIADLAPYAKNSRTHSLKQIHELDIAIGAYGFTNPILVDSAGIVAGHGRLEAVKARYVRGDLVRLPNGEVIPTNTIPTLDCSGWTDAQRRAYIIFDNKSALNAGWDEDILASELLALSQADFDMELTGFNSDELSDLISDGDTGGLTDENSTPDVPTNPVTVSGDVWLLGDHRVMCGDSTSTENVKTLMNGALANMIFTDPPYGVDYEGIKNDSRTGLTDLLAKVFANYVAITKPGSAFYCFHSDRCADIFHTAYRAVAHFSSMIIWVKPSLVLSQTDYQSRHEPCLYGWIEGARHSWYSDRKQTSVWEFDNESVIGHTTPKPVSLIEEAIKNSSKKCQIIIDLFGGSGSTLIGAERTNRICYTMEMQECYIDVIVKRWQAYTGLEATLESTGQTFSQVATDRSNILATE